jgi:glutamate-1-semialdehyde 2,1-aminomutase
MAELIVRFFPSIQKVRMCNSGTEATMSAIRLARGFTKRDKIIKFAGCYHGHSDSLLIKAGSGALTHGHPDSAGVPASFARETVVLPYNDRAALAAAFAANPGQIAGVIIEPYCGNVGFIMPDAGYLAYLREITAQHGTVLIFDEVMTGFRIAKGGVQEREAIVPTSPVSAKSSAAVCPSEPSVGGPTSWIISPRSVRFIRPARSAATRSPWPPASRALQLLAELDPYARLDARPPVARCRARRCQGEGPAGPGPAVRLDVQHLLHRHAGARLRDRADRGRETLRRAFSTPASTWRRLPGAERVRGRLHQHRPRGSGH